MSPATTTREVVLVVQCCQPAQFRFALEKLRANRPEWRLHVLAVDSPEIRSALETGVAPETVHWLSAKTKPFEIQCDRVVFPLLNRGFAAIKRVGRSIPAPHWEMDYEGTLRKLERRRLPLSVLRSPHRATPEFETFLRKCPPPLLGQRILLVHSADGELVEKTRQRWSRCVPPGADVTTVAGSVTGREFRSLLRRDFDSAILFLSGERGFLTLKLLPFLLRIPRILSFNESGIESPVSPGTIPLVIAKRFLHGVAVPDSPPRILLIQTESAAYMAEAVARLKGETLYPGAEIILLCREADRGFFERMAGIGRVLTYHGALKAENLLLPRRLRNLRPDIVSAVFSGRGVFRPAKALFFLFADVPMLAFNARLDCYWLSARSFTRLFRKDALLFEGTRPAGVPVVVIQTEDWRYTLEAIRKVRTPTLYPRARVILLCSERDRHHFSGEPGVDTIESFESIRERSWWSLRRRLRRERPEVVVAVFSGRPVYRKAKLLFISLVGTPQLVFNAGLDAYWLGIRSLTRLLRREPLLFGLDERSPSEALLIQTESVGVTLDAVALMLSGRVVPQKQIAVFCRDDVKTRFANHPGVGRVYSWSPGKSLENLKTIWRMSKVDRDVSAAILSGRSVFRAQKLLFFLLPTRNRLVVNENLDCFYMKRSRVAKLFRAPTIHLGNRPHPPIGLFVRTCLKGLLFLPRFTYLLGWLTLAKLRRARQKEGAVLPQGER